MDPKKLELLKEKIGNVLEFEYGRLSSSGEKELLECLVLLK